MNPTFEVLFVIDRTGKLELVLTDTTNVANTFGRFKIRYPDGVSVENDQDFEFPQVEKRYDLRTRKSNLITGSYEITQYLNDGVDEFEAQKVFDLTFEDPSLILSDNSATSQPSVSFKDNTVYAISGYNTSISRVIKSKFPDQTEIETELATPSSELYMSDSGNFYEGLYYPNLSVEVLYTGDEHDVRWIQEKDFKFEVKGFIGLSQLLVNLDTIKSRLDSNNGNSAQLRNDYLMATSIYTHIIARLGGDVSYDAKQLVDKAKEWAVNPEDEEVEPGLFSAFHFSKKAEANALLSSLQLVNVDAPVKFDIDQQIGSHSNPISTDISFDLTNAVPGTATSIFHQAAVAPTLGTNIRKLLVNFAMIDYEINQLNKFVFYYLEDPNNNNEPYLEIYHRKNITVIEPI